MSVIFRMIVILRFIYNWFMINAMKQKHPNQASLYIRDLDIGKSSSQLYREA